MTTDMITQTPTVHPMGLSRHQGHADAPPARRHGVRAALGINTLTAAMTLGLLLSPLGARAQTDTAERPHGPAPAAPQPAPVVPASPAAPVAPGVPPRLPPAELAELAARAAEQARMDIDTRFAGVLMKRERVVKGAPYCAQAVHETVQPLLDGNRIVHQQASQLCRDGEGRTRQEVDRQGRRLVYLRDPVSGENWLLDPARKTARFLGGRVEDDARREEAERQRDYAERQKDYAERMRDYAERMREWTRQRTESLRDRWSPNEAATQASGTGGPNPRPSPRPDPHPNPNPNPRPDPTPSTGSDAVVDARPSGKTAPMPPPPPIAPRAVVIAPAIDRQEVHIIQIDTPDGVGTPVPPIPAAVGLSAERLSAASGKARVETLPTRELAGLKVNGRRTTTTIEAGKVGNEKPIIITNEIWTSPDLQLTVSSVQKDPRSGEQNYQLKDIRRGEPDATLMKVPADYQRSGQPTAKKG